jgi:hypothetical protein
VRDRGRCSRERVAPRRCGDAPGSREGRRDTGDGIGTDRCRDPPAMLDGRCGSRERMGATSCDNAPGPHQCRRCPSDRVGAGRCCDLPDMQNTGGAAGQAVSAGICRHCLSRSSGYRAAEVGPGEVWREQVHRLLAQTEGAETARGDVFEIGGHAIHGAAKVNHLQRGEGRRASHRVLGEGPR